MKDTTKSPSSTNNLIQLFNIHNRECDKLYEDAEAQDECLICFDPLRDKTHILKFLA